MRLSEDDPGVYISWNIDALDAFVNNANLAPGMLPPRPAWLRAGPLTVAGFMQDAIATLALSGGGSFGNSIIAPNTMAQYTNVNVVLSRIELDAFVQACLPQGEVLGTCAILMDRSIAHAMPMGRIAPPLPNRIVFR